MIKKALITGVNGQDGSYLAELLIEKDFNWSPKTDLKTLVKVMVESDLKKIKNGVSDY
tara:strand:- start:2068 stop:2241 length:174 start_codon:yes stop_codon:yes gene_type:complete